MNTSMRIGAIALLIGLAACGGGTPDPASAAGAAGRDGRTGAFTVAPEQLAHLQIVDVRSDTFTAAVKATGTVDWNTDDTSAAITQVSGPVTRILVDTGAHVKAGQPLLYVASPDVTGAVATYRKAKNRLELAKQNLDRSRDLLAHKAVAQRDFEEAQADYNDAETDVKAALEALRILGVSARQVEEAERQNEPISTELPVRAPLTGTVVAKSVSPGQVIEAGATSTFIVSNVSTVWVQAHVYERDLRLVHVGDLAEVRSPSSPGTFEGKVTYIGSMLDPATRTTPVRVVTKNPNGLLKKDQFVDVIIHDRTSHDALVVPTSAVLYDEQNIPFVYLQAGEGQFVRRPITLGAQHDDRVEVADGLKSGDRVVSQGSVFLQFANSYEG